MVKIPGLSDVSLLGNDSLNEIKSSKVILAGLGKKFEKLLQHSTVKLDYRCDVVQAIHNFALDGVCNFNSVDFTSLLTAAKELNIIGIKTQAVQHVLTTLSIANALEWHQLSIKLFCVHTQGKTKEFLLNNFEDVGQNENFLKACKPSWMIELIKDENLNATEENIFQIVVKWAQQSIENEQELKNSAFYIRFELMDKIFFEAVVKACPILQNHPSVKAADISVQNSRLRPPKDRSRVPYELVFAVSGYMVQVYNSSANRWQDLAAAFPVEEFDNPWLQGAVVVNDQLVTLGAPLGLQEVCAYIFNFKKKVWSRSPKRNRYCLGSTVVELGGLIY